MPRPPLFAEEGWGAESDPGEDHPRLRNMRHRHLLRPGGVEVGYLDTGCLYNLWPQLGRSTHRLGDAVHCHAQHEEEVEKHADLTSYNELKWSDETGSNG